MKRLVMMLTIAALLAAPSWAQPGQLKKDLCTQADFALMLATAIWSLDGTGPNDEERDFTPQTAIERLTLVELTPNAGWQPDKIVTRKVMQEVLAQIHASYSAQNPSQELTRQEVAGFIYGAEPAIYRYQCRGMGNDFQYEDLLNASHWEHIFKDKIFRPYYALPAYTK